MIDMRAEQMHLHTVRVRSCRMGVLLEMFSRVVALALSRQTEDARTAANALVQQQAWAWDGHDGANTASIPEKAFFDLAGCTPTELLYVMDQLVSAHLSPLRSFRGHSDPEFIFDFGSEGGGDINYYIFQKHAKVLGIDADPRKLQKIRVRLGAAHVPQYGPGWELLQAAVVEGSMEEVDVDQALGGRNFLEKLKLNVSERMSCAHIALQFPWDAASANKKSYWKVDLDGYEVACLQSLLNLQGGRVPNLHPRSFASPRLISVEFAHVFLCRFTTSNCAAASVRQQAAQLDVLRLLFALGYRRFKLVRQRFYNLLATAHGIEGGWDEDPGGMIQRFGSGLVGDEAVDYVSGTSWRSFSDILSELVFLQLELHAGKADEWYDLHAELDGD